MSFFNKYPYSDMHELNLDWLIAKMKELNIAFDEFKVINQITFSGAWDITKQYPAWTIVSDNNIGYVSIQPVPAGILLTNGNYWQEVIDYTAQIAGLQSRVVALENTVGDASSGLVKDVNDLQTDMISVQNDLNIIKNPIVLLMSDSYGVNATTPTRWSWFDTFESFGDVEVKKNALGGASFCGNNVNKYLDCLNNIISGMTDDEKARTETIIIGGGYNDTMSPGSFSDTVTAINAFKSACSVFPNLKTYQFYFIGNTASSTDKYTMFNGKMILEKALLETGFGFADIGYMIHDYDNLMQTDGIHPTEEGSKLLGGGIHALYKGRSSKLIPSINSVCAFTTTQSIGTANFRIFSTDNEMHVAIGNLDITKSTTDTAPLTLDSTPRTPMHPMKEYYKPAYMVVDGTACTGFLIARTENNGLRVILRPMITGSWTNIKISSATIDLSLDEC